MLSKLEEVGLLTATTVAVLLMIPGIIIGFRVLTWLDREKDFFAP